MSAIVRVSRAVERATTLTVPELESKQSQLSQNLGLLEKRTESIYFNKERLTTALNAWQREWDGLKGAWERARRGLMQLRNAK